MKTRTCSMRLPLGGDENGNQSAKAAASQRFAQGVQY
jgi:hypothetical protein